MPRKRFAELIREFKDSRKDTPRLLDAIKPMLISKMKVMSFYHSSPVALGYDDHRTWKDPDAFFDIHSDCYMSVFIKKADLLMELAMQNDDEEVDRILHMRIRRFLINKFRGANPVDYAIFKNIESALKILEKDLHLVRFENLKESEGVGRLHNYTRVYPSSLGNTESAKIVSKETLHKALESDSRWESLRSRLKTERAEYQIILADLLGEAFSRGLGPIRIKQLLDHVKEFHENCARKAVLDWFSDKTDQTALENESDESSENLNDELVNMFEILRERINTHKGWQKKTKEKLVVMLDYYCDIAMVEGRSPTLLELGELLETTGKLSTVHDLKHKLQEVILEAFPNKFPKNQKMLVLKKKKKAK